MKTEKEKSPRELLSSIEWAKVEVGGSFIWFKSKFGISDAQLKVLDLMLKKALQPAFKIGENDPFYFQGIVSFTIMVDYLRPESRLIEQSMQFFADNLHKLFIHENTSDTE